MNGRVEIDAIDNGFVVRGHFNPEGGYGQPVKCYFDDFEGALDFIREEAGKVMDAEVEEYLTADDYSLDLDDDGLPIGWTDLDEDEDD